MVLKEPFPVKLVGSPQAQEQLQVALSWSLQTTVLCSER